MKRKPVHRQIQPARTPAQYAGLVTLTLGGSIAVGLVLILLAGTLIRLTGGQISDTQGLSEVMASWGGGIIGIVSAYIGYSFGRDTPPRQPLPPIDEPSTLPYRKPQPAGAGPRKSDVVPITPDQYRYPPAGHRRPPAERGPAGYSEPPTQIRPAERGPAGYSEPPTQISYPDGEGYDSAGNRV